MKIGSEQVKKNKEDICKILINTIIIVIRNFVRGKIYY